MATQEHSVSTRGVPWWVWLTAGVYIGIRVARRVKENPLIRAHQAVWSRVRGGNGEHGDKG